MNNCEHKSRWDIVRNSMAEQSVTFGHDFANSFKFSPADIHRYLSFYKFAAKVIGHEASVLDVGCREGLGTWLLASECKHALGIDRSNSNIQRAAENWNSPKVLFECHDDIPVQMHKSWDSAVYFNIPITCTCDTYDILSIASCIHSAGTAVIGIPCSTNAEHKSDGCPHSISFLEREMLKRFYNVFIFSALSEIILAGHVPSADYNIGIGCMPRS